MANYSRIEGSKFQIQSIEEFKDPRIYCIILTTSKNLRTKVPVIVQSWAKKCNNYSLVTLLPSQFNTTGISSHILERVLQPTGLLRDTYDRLTDKVLLAFKQIYSQHPDYDWYLKADDDTYIFSENLQYFLSLRNPFKPVYYGLECNQRLFVF